MHRYCAMSRCIFSNQTPFSVNINKNRPSLSPSHHRALSATLKYGGGFVAATSATVAAAV